MSGSRVTIIIDPDVEKKLRRYQASMITETSKSYPLTRAINDLLRESL